MLKNTVKIINQIADIQGTNAKIDIVKVNIDNELMKDIFAFQFDDKIKTKVSIKKLTKDVDLSKADIEVFDIYNYMSFLANDCSGKHSDVATIKNYVSFCKKEYGDEVGAFVAKLAMKGVKLGSLGRKGIAKIYGDGFLDKVESMSGVSWEENKNKKDVKGKNVCWSIKLDGNRLHTVLHEDGTSETYSRKGLIQEGFDEIISEFRKLNYPYEEFIDYEVRLPKKESETAGSCFRRTQTVVKTKGVKKGLVARVFDMIPSKDFKNGEYKVSYSKRRKRVESFEKSYIVKPTDIVYVGNDDDRIKKLMSEIVNEQLEEGLIGFLEDSNWKAGKSRRLLKYKPFKDVDLRITGFEQGDPAKSFSDTLGAIVVDWKGSDVSVGSGLSRELRDEIWNNKHSYIDRIIQVRYLEESFDDKGKPSLRHPSLQCFRDDKKTVSYE